MTQPLSPLELKIIFREVSNFLPYQKQVQLLRCVLKAINPEYTAGLMERRADSSKRLIADPLLTGAVMENSPGLKKVNALLTHAQRENRFIDIAYIIASPHFFPFASQTLPNSYARAATRGQHQMMDMLEQSKHASEDQRDLWRRLGFGCASLGNQIETIDKLLPEVLSRQDADQIIYGGIICASREGSIEILKKLLPYTLTFLISNLFGLFIAVEYAAKEGRENVVDFLISFLRTHNIQSNYTNKSLKEVAGKGYYSIAAKMIDLIPEYIRASSVFLLLRIAALCDDRAKATLFRHWKQQRPTSYSVCRLLLPFVQLWYFFKKRLVY